MKEGSVPSREQKSIDADLSDFPSVTESSEGLLFSVKAQPGSRRNAIAGVHAGALKVCVTQAPEKGKANDAILEVLADKLHLKRNQIQIASGATTSLKKFVVVGITIAELQERFRSALE